MGQRRARASAERERLSDRHRRVRHLYDPVLAALPVWLAGDTSMPSITRLAEWIAEARRARIDCMARRLKEAMICWLCENAPELAFGFALPVPAERLHLLPRRQGHRQCGSSRSPWRNPHLRISSGCRTKSASRRKAPDSLGER
jgi:hypothetical protein